MALMMRTSAVLLALAAYTLAHSHVDKIWAPNPSVHYQGWNPNYYDSTPYPDDTPGWYNENQGGNPLYPRDLTTSNIICAKNASPANFSAPITAGETVRVKWDAPGEWPPSHKGPVVDYIAACNGPCSEVEPEALEFVKIAELGWIDASRDSGFWAADKLRDDDSIWDITIPSGLKAGEYVLRTEIIALHVANLPEPFGAEFYPQCVSLTVTGDGDKVVSGGVVAESLYKPTDPGVNYTTLHDGDEHADYIIPGPAVWIGA